MKIPLRKQVKDSAPPVGRGGGDSNITVTGMLIVSLWVVNCTLWVFGMECYCICPKEIYKKCPDTDYIEISLLSVSRTHIDLPSGLTLNFPASIPLTFIWEFPPEFRVPRSALSPLSNVCSFRLTI